MKNSLIVISVCIILSSCSGKKDEQSVNLDFSMKTVHVESFQGCAQDSIPCASFEVIYPVFSKLKPEVSERLQILINEGVAYDNPEAEGLSIEEMANQFTHDFEKFYTEFPENSTNWYFKTSFEVQLASDTLISLSANSEFFTGGAHGGYSIYFVNVDPANGNKVSLQTYLKAGFEDVLNEEGEKSFRQVRELKDEDNLAEQGFEFPNGKFTVNTNYGFRMEGIVFVFNSYEIAAYAMGPTEILIPWEVLVNWRK